MSKARYHPFLWHVTDLIFSCAHADGMGDKVGNLLGNIRTARNAGPACPLAEKTCWKFRRHLL